jgi:divalent metal cation (Fe/Co/Zn/Cd) transporter
VIDEEAVRAVVYSVPKVIGCEKIRTRGSADHAFMDLHVWLDPQTPLQDAHATSHVVKDKLMSRFPQLVDVVIHIEPPPPDSEAGMRDSRFSQPAARISSPPE